MTCDPRSIANYILDFRSDFGYQTTQLELQKLLYFSHGLYLCRFGEKLVDGYFEAWKHGPVHPLIFKEFREFGKAPISRRAWGTNLISGERKLIESPEDKRVCAHVAETVLQLRHLTASQLRRKSHAKGGPWHSVWESARINLASGMRIPDNVIIEHYHRNILSVEAASEVLDDSENYPTEPYRSS